MSSLSWYYPVRKPPHRQKIPPKDVYNWMCNIISNYYYFTYTETPSHSHRGWIELEEDTSSDRQDRSVGFLRVIRHSILHKRHMVTIRPWKELQYTWEPRLGLVFANLEGGSHYWTPTVWSAFRPIINPLSSTPRRRLIVVSLYLWFNFYLSRNFDVDVGLLLYILPPFSAPQFAE